MQLIPITKAYRKGYEGIEWDVDDMGVVRAVPCKKIDTPHASGSASGFTTDADGTSAPLGGHLNNGSPFRLALDKIPGMPAARYWGC